MRTLHQAASAAALLLLAGAGRADIAIPFPHDPSSGVTIKLSSPVAGVPHFGFMPIHVSIENLTTHDGIWRFQFEAGSRGSFPGVAVSAFELAVPAPQTREAWFYVPIAEPGPSLSSAAVMPASASMGGSILPSGPPVIAGVYPDPRLPGVTFQMRSVIGSSSAGLTRTFTIVQEGPATALPMLARDRLPPQVSMTVTPPDAKGMVTRTTIAVVVASPTSGGFARATSGPPVAMRNATTALAAAGLAPTGIRSSMSGRGTATEMTVTIRQMGPATLLPLPPLDKLPKGFTAVNVSTDPSGETVREFTYVENTPATAMALPPVTAASSGGTAGWYMGGGTAPPGSSPLPMGNTGLLSASPAAAEAEARRLLAPTGLLQTPASVTTRAMTSMVSSPPGVGVMRSYPMVIFDQTGPRGDLPRPSASALPAPVRVTLHPGLGGNISRVITVIDPSVATGFQAALSGSTVPATIGVQTLARLELQRSGFLRFQAGVTQSASVRSSPGGASDTFIFSESGAPNLLPDVPAADLPKGITCNVTQGPLPGEVSRNFIVPIGPFLATLGASASGASSSGAGTLRLSGGGFAVGGGLTAPGALNIDVAGPGVAPGTRAAFPNAIGATGMMPLATTPALDGLLRSKLAVSGMRSLPNVSAFDPAQVPADWRVWSSFSGVVLKAEEFAALDRARRSALRTWVASGGVLFLLPSAARTAQTDHVGAGRIETLPEPLDEVVGSEVTNRFQLTTPPPAVPDRDRLQFAAGTPLGEAVKFEPADMLWLSLFLIAFAILIGPVNVLFFAPATKRHRLFLTTPLLSAGGALAVAVAILIQDGVGGTGVRRAVVVLVPDESQAVVFQEQAARSGFLTSRQFALDDAVLCAALPADVLPTYGSLDFRDRRGRATGSADGDWFRNRSRQAQLLRAVVPTRARVEIVGTTADGAPIVESTVATELRDFRLRDEQGVTWTAATLPTGRRFSLTRASAETHPPELDGSPNLQAVLRETATLTVAGQWSAEGGGTEVAPVATLGSIRWRSDRIVYAGVATRDSAARTASQQTMPPK